MREKIRLLSKKMAFLPYPDAEICRAEAEIFQTLDDAAEAGDMQKALSLIEQAEHMCFRLASHLSWTIYNDLEDAVAGIGLDLWQIRMSRM